MINRINEKNMMVIKKTISIPTIILAGFWPILKIWRIKNKNTVGQKGNKLAK